MPLVYEEIQKYLPQVVASHLPFTFLILEAVSFNVNQSLRERLLMTFWGIHMNFKDERYFRFLTLHRMTELTLH